MDPLSILIVDDEDAIRSLLEALLTREGHSATCISGGLEAFRVISDPAQHFDLLITDIVMGEGDGLELITRIRKSGSQIPILALSGGGSYLRSTDCIRMADGLGANAHLAKPFALWELAHAIDQALGSKVAA